MYNAFDIESLIFCWFRPPKAGHVSISIPSNLPADNEKLFYDCLNHGAKVPPRGF
ncbi:hypothetical protein CLOSTASPAR_02668 [[Clostridium] asparagiforme DSM 15981]|uniref:Uncharacterized protein n=1 Tax=[Clostridium] asparagiforme DSM 15981 TaxID=518636 RepID=C0D087_9FIRM|nr:hypothetical protein CLOSTASPAR_02668 [[Clostridium] asparagiforme DSM 15981]